MGPAPGHDGGLLVRGAARHRPLPRRAHAQARRPARTDAQLFQRWLALFRQTTATLGNDAMAERANELAGRIAESLWYGYQASRADFAQEGHA